MDLYKLMRDKVIMASLTIISATDIILPSLHHMADYFKASEEEIQITILLYLRGSFFSASILGVFSEFFGRSLALFFGMVFFLLGAVLCVYPPTFKIFNRSIFQGYWAAVVLA